MDNRLWDNRLWDPKGNPFYALGALSKDWTSSRPPGDTSYRIERDAVAISWMNVGATSARG